uniref:Uncharacterized protein n=1 Tax=Anopheles arabiensis TaxID=7173 RepID=A0A182IGA4_ANOAR
MHLFCLLFVCLLYLFSYLLCLMSPYSSPFFFFLFYLFFLNIVMLFSFMLLKDCSACLYCFSMDVWVFLYLLNSVFFCIVSPHALSTISAVGPLLPTQNQYHSLFFNVVCLHRSILLAFTLSFSLSL